MNHSNWLFWFSGATRPHFNRPFCFVNAGFFFWSENLKNSLHNSPQTKSHITSHAGRLTNTKLQYDAMTFPFHKTYSYLVFSSVPVDSAPSFTCQLWNLSLRQCCLPRCTHSLLACPLLLHVRQELRQISHLKICPKELQFSVKGK